MAVTTYGRRETLINNWQNQLNGAIDNVVTTIVVDDTTGLPTAGWFRIQIEDEIIYCSGCTATDINVVTRGAEGSTAASHSDNVAVKAVLTAGGFQKFLLEHRGAAFSEESTTKSVPVNRLLDQDGNVLTASSFSWINQGTASVADSNGGLQIITPSEASNVLRALVLPTSGMTTPYRFYARIRIGPGIGTTPGANAAHAGLCFYQASSGKFVTLSARYGGSLSMWRWTNTTTFSATVDTNSEFHEDRIWLMFQDDGTNFKGFFSHDGNNWTTNAAAWWTESRTAFLLTTSASDFGIYVNSGSGLTGQMITVESFIVEEY